MTSKKTSSSKIPIILAVLAVIIGLISVIFVDFTTFKTKTIEFVSNNFNVDLKQRLETKPIRDKPTEEPFRSPPKISEFSSCAVFLDQIRGLTLDDFNAIDNQNANDLTLSHISSFNNLQLGPRIQSIVRMDYFKFVKLNLHRRCTLWPDAHKCVLK